jgi:hypothetical protein
VLGFGTAGRKPPQHILVSVPLLLAAKVTSMLALQQSLSRFSRFLVKAGFGNNVFGHRMILRQVDLRCQLARVTNKSNN